MAAEFSARGLTLFTAIHARIDKGQVEHWPSCARRQLQGSHDAASGDSRRRTLEVEAARGGGVPSQRLIPLGDLNRPIAVVGRRSTHLAELTKSFAQLQSAGWAD